jgi:hypothetical protein
MLKACYAFGLRRWELVSLDVHDCGRNPKAPEFDEFQGVRRALRQGVEGSPPKRRRVLTVMAGRGARAVGQ